MFDRSVVDEWYKSGDEESFHYARRLIKEEGLLCGQSLSGCVYLSVCLSIYLSLYMHVCVCVCVCVNVYVHVASCLIAAVVPTQVVVVELLCLLH